MTADAAATVDQLLLEHLESSGLSKDAYELVLAAVFGEAELQEALGRASAVPPPTPPDGATSPEPVGAYLARIEARGFCGIGEAATLDLVPGPGLTIVTGRNGSGKSSFAEAAELALTGQNPQWAGHGQQWRQGWKNLHVTGGRYVRVGLGLDGHRGGATVECHWDEGAGAGEGVDLDDRTSFLQRAGERRRPVTDLGWRQAMELYRPFLSYAELGQLLSGRPSQMYDSLHSVLGLGRLADLENQLKAARRDSDQGRKLAAADLPALRDTLAAHSDQRARNAERLLAAPTVDLDELEQLAVDVRDGQDGASGHATAGAGGTYPARPCRGGGTHRRRA